MREAMFSTILIANRGEIALRIMRSCRAMGIGTVAVYSDADRDALHVREADQAIRLGPAIASASYLHVERILAAARQSGAQAIHPGYGFLSERAHFVAACEAAGITFIGPPAHAMALMGDKVAAKRLAMQVGVPTVPGFQPEPGAIYTSNELQIEAERIGFPVLIKAAAGGGGKGMRVVYAAPDFVDALAAAQREAQAAFGDSSVFLEKLIERPRHVEIQILADAHGQCVHLFERECSIQRRHQKIVEESPSVALTPALRAAMGASAVQLAQAAGYVNAGTIEFLLGADGQYYFLEMNTRLQVEHPVTELVTGLDLVRLQIEIAARAGLPFRQDELQQQGHAIEVRICAEDPQSFLPASGELAFVAFPDSDLARSDSGVVAGDTIGINYDSLLAKVIVHAADRRLAIAQLQQALTNTALLGVTTNLALLHVVAAHPAFAAGDTTTDFLERHAIQVADQEQVPSVVAASAVLLTSQREFAQLSNDPWAAGAWRLSGSGAVRRYLWQGQEVAIQLQQTLAAYQITIAEASIDCTIVAQGEGQLVLAIEGEENRVAYHWQAGTLMLGWQGREYRLQLAPALQFQVQTIGRQSGHAQLEAPMPGTVLRLMVAEGESVVAHQPLLVLEAMKMEYVVAAPYAGVVERLFVAIGALVARGTTLAEVRSAEL
jgi:3-methylcrotonyl-CoA carboxylase alpha subunit